MVSLLSLVIVSHLDINATHILIYVSHDVWMAGCDVRKNRHLFITNNKQIWIGRREGRLWKSMFICLMPNILNDTQNNKRQHGRINRWKKYKLKHNKNSTFNQIRPGRQIKLTQQQAGPTGPCIKRQNRRTERIKGRSSRRTDCHIIVDDSFRWPCLLSLS